MSLDQMLSLGYYPIGVDIGATGVKLLQLRKQGPNFGLVAAARVDLPTDDRMLQSDEYVSRLSAAIARRAETGGFRGKRCVLSLDDRMLRVRSVRHPLIPEAELDKAIRLDAPTRLGFAEGEEGEYGWLQAGEVRQADEAKQEIILVGAARARVEQLVFALVEAGLRPEAVEPGFIACARSFSRTLRRAVDQAVTRVVINIGERTTGVMVTRGQTVAFYKPLEIGGDTMTRAAAERLGLEVDAVRDLRKQRAAAAARGEEPRDARVDRALFESVRPLMDELAREVSMCLRYYGVTFRGSRPDACLVVGGEAEEPQLVQLLADELHVPTSVGRPLEGIEISNGAALGGDSSSARAEWAVSAGLALRSWHLRQTSRSRRRGTDRSAETTPPAPQQARSAA